MKIQVQPNKWSCLPTAFATVLDIPVNDLIKEIGHDGSKIVDPMKKDPFGRRSFHIQEISEILLDRAIGIITFEMLPTILIEDKLSGFEYPIYHDEDMVHSRIDKIMKNFSGVITGVTTKQDKKGNVVQKRHAVSWNHKEQTCYDPNGTIHDVKKDKFFMEYLYIVQRLMV
jgi:hypothetical protein